MSIVDQFIIYTMQTPTIIKWCDDRDIIIPNEILNRENPISNIEFIMLTINDIPALKGSMSEDLWVQFNLTFSLADANKIIDDEIDGIMSYLNRIII